MNTAGYTIIFGCKFRHRNPFTPVFFIISCSFLFLFFFPGKTVGQRSYPQPIGFKKPIPGPNAPGEAFQPVMSGSPAANTPICAEWTQTAGTDESVLITGVQFSRYSGVDEGKDTRFSVFSNGGFRDARIQRVDSNKAIITLPEGSGMRLIWPENENGFGSPIAVNKTDVWWVGPDRAYKGETVSVYGRNLSKDNDSLVSYVYLKPRTGGGGQWVNVSKVNPYKVDFIVPTSLSDGEYEVWAHNGHGGEYGWSGPSLLNVRTRLNWTSTTFNVRNFGAKGDGITDDTQAILNAFKAASQSSRSTVFFPQGIYMVSNTLYFNSNVRYRGEGPSSVIKCATNFSAQSWGFLYAQGQSNVEISDLCFNTNYSYRGNYSGPIFFRANQELRISNVKFQFQDYNVFDLNNSTHVFVTGCELIGKISFLGNCSQLFVDRCDFKQTNDAEVALHSWGGVGVSITNSTSSDFDNRDVSNGRGWGMGRFFVGNGIWGSNRLTYLANNVTRDLGVRPGGIDQNAGEQVMWEGNFTIWSGTPQSSSANSMVCPGLIATGDKSRFAVIVKGRGLGQSRRIIGYSGSSITLESPWNVVPDQTSVVNIGTYTDKIVVYNNILDGKQSATTSPAHTASSGIQPFGGSLNLIADNNTLQELRAGISNWVTKVPEGNGLDPNFFSFYVNNKIVRCRWAVINADGYWNQQIAPDRTGILGTVYRRNIIQDAILVGIRNDIGTPSYPVFDGMLYERNTVTNSPIAFQSTALGTSNHLFYRNSFSGSGGFGISGTSNLALRENVISGFGTTYSGSLEGPVIEAPYHVVEVNGFSGGSTVESKFILWNSGTSQLNWSISESTDWLSLTPASGVIATERDSSVIKLFVDPSKLTQGSYIADIGVTSGSLRRTYRVRFVVSNPPNTSAPVANAGQDQLINQPASQVTLTGSGTDSDGTITAYSWVLLTGTGGTISSPNSASTSVTGLSVGTYSFELTVTDNQGASGKDTVVVIVNSLPSVNAGIDQIITLPSSQVTLSAIASDIDGVIDTYSWLKVSGPAAVVSNSASQTASVSGLTEGVYLFRVFATDNRGATASDDVQVTVNAAAPPSGPSANQPPVVLTGGNQTITLPLNSVTLDGSGSSDADGTILSYVWSQVSGPSVASLGGTNSAVLTAGSLVSGSYIFRLTVTDNSGASASIDVVVTVNAGPAPPAPTPAPPAPTPAPPVPTPPPPAPIPNLPPVARAGADQTITLPLNAVVLDGSGSTDTDGSIISYTWSQISGPSSASISGSSSVSVSIGNLVQGSYVFRLTVTDDRGASSSGDVNVTVNAAPATPPQTPNQRPVVNVGADQTITLPVNTVTLDGSSSSDPDGSIVSWAWRKITGPASYSIITPNASATIVSGLLEGLYEFELTITDDKGLSASGRVRVYVNKVNLKPIVLTADTVETSTKIPHVALSGVDSYDPDGSIISQRWTFKKGPRNPKIIWPDSTRTIVADLVEGLYEFEYMVTDNDGETASKLTVVKVTKGNDSPSKLKVNLYPNPVVNETNLTLDSELNGRTLITIYDAGGRMVRYEVFRKDLARMSKRLNLSGLSNGIYVINVNLVQTEAVSIKMVKQ